MEYSASPDHHACREVLNETRKRRFQEVLCDDERAKAARPPQLKATQGSRLAHLTATLGSHSPVATKQPNNRSDGESFVSLSTDNSTSTYQPNTASFDSWKPTGTQALTPSLRRSEAQIPIFARHPCDRCVRKGYFCDKNQPKCSRCRVYDASCRYKESPDNGSNANEENLLKPIPLSARQCRICSTRGYHCDRVMPTCGYCSRKGFNCHFNQHPPAISSKEELVKAQESVLVAPVQILEANQQEKTLAEDALGDAGTSDDEEYEVEAIVAKRTRSGKVEYRVRWRGYGKEDDTWEELGNLSHAKELINEFRRQERLAQKESEERRYPDTHESAKPISTPSNTQQLLSCQSLDPVMTQIAALKEKVAMIQASPTSGPKSTFESKSVLHGQIRTMNGSTVPPKQQVVSQKGKKAIPSKTYSSSQFTHIGYNKDTVASDVLVAIGKHPYRPWLNARSATLLGFGSAEEQHANALRLANGMRPF